MIQKSLILTNFNNFKQDPFPEIYRILLTNRIATLSREINYDYKLCKIHYNNLHLLLPAQIFTTSIDVVNLNLTRKTRKYKQHLSEKMSILCNNSIWKTFSNTSLVTNLSNYRPYRHRTWITRSRIRFFYWTFEK